MVFKLLFTTEFDSISEMARNSELKSSKQSVISNSTIALESEYMIDQSVRDISVVTLANYGTVEFKLKFWIGESDQTNRTVLIKTFGYLKKSFVKNCV